MLQLKLVGKIKKHALRSVFSKIVRFLENVQKCYSAEEDSDDNMAQAHCMLDT